MCVHAAPATSLSRLIVRMGYSDSPKWSFSLSWPWQQEGVSTGHSQPACLKNPSHWGKQTAISRKCDKSTPSPLEIAHLCIISKLFHINSSAWALTVMNGTVFHCFSGNVVHTVSHWRKETYAPGFSPMGVQNWTANHVTLLWTQWIWWQPSDLRRRQISTFFPAYVRKYSWTKLLTLWLSNL